MPLGHDQQYDLSWEEQDKIRRRLELKKRLKIEGIRKRYDPFLQMKEQTLTDPAVERYSDLRKKGRMPNTPLSPKIFFSMLGMIVIPIYGLHKLISYNRDPELRMIASGEIPYKDRRSKTLL